jgi:hypothetical protein
MPQSTDEELAWADADDPRRVAHELVGQAHAVLVLAHRDAAIEVWCVPALRESVAAAAPDLWIAVGEMQAAIAEGWTDGDLLSAGIGGRVSRAKRGALRLATERLARALGRGRAVAIRKWLKSAAGLARTAVGSMVREVPGGEIIAEALDGVLAGLDTVEAMATDDSHPDDSHPDDSQPDDSDGEGRRTPRAAPSKRTPTRRTG